MTCYPVIIPTLNRYEHFKNCVESLSKNLLANETELIIGLDYPPSEKYEEGWKKIKEYIPNIKGFKNITCFERKKNLGSMNNSAELENYVLSKYDAYIYTEDDNVFSPYFLEFINDGLKKYKDDESIIAICGYSYPIDWNTDKDIVIQNQYFSAWGYGTWGRKAQQLQQDLNNEFIKRTINSSNFHKMKKKAKANFINYMGFVLEETINSFDVTRSFYMYLTDKSVLMPSKTLVTNNGWDGSGEHCQNITVIDFTNPNRNDKRKLDINSFEKVYSEELDFIFNSIYSNIRRAKILLFLVRTVGISITRKIKKIIKR